ncbi:CRISPR-associated endonuclease Cas2 [Faecalibaculum rodentium]|uniref:CRISPR-associated endoribonuclease Cas2 n=1 Tax=Faecalibaculum rodentium TaxID=1702221 RepID=A0A140DRJ1_9FIRM|nr:CRISPR-associated endonuclease Cas2 [Faecalibaculum rodentium]AMK53268.1 hypothetical protein AALO17_01340 [Faecalibaculum rodentium]
MNVICVYDVDSAKCVKLMKVLRRYLFHVQDSVFQGVLTPKQFRVLQNELKELTSEKDSVIFYFTYNDKDLNTTSYGRAPEDRTIIM